MRDLGSLGMKVWVTVPGKKPRAVKFRPKLRKFWNEWQRREMTYFHVGITVAEETVAFFRSLFCLKLF